MNLTRPLVLAAFITLVVAGCSKTSTSFSEPTLAPLYGTAGDDNGFHVTTNEQSYLYTLGSTYFSGSTEVVLKRFNPLGQELWSTEVDTCDDTCSPYGEDVSTDAVGNVYVASRNESNVNAERSSTLRKFSPTGSLLWSRHLVSDIYPIASSIATVASGETFVAVQYKFLAKYSSTGELLFKKPLASPVEDLDVALDGSLYTAGDSQLVKYSSAGKVLWQRAVPMGRIVRDLIAVRGDNVYYGAANSEVNRIRLYKYTAKGVLVWKRYFKPVNAIPSIAALSTDRNGNVYMAGGLAITGADWTSFVRKYTRSGAVAWTYKPPLSGSSYDYAFGISAADSGRSYVTGVTSGPVNGTNYGSTDAYLLRLDTRGKEVWQR